MQTIRAFRNAPSGQKLRAAPFASLLLAIEVVLTLTSFRTTRNLFRRFAVPARRAEWLRLSPDGYAGELAAVGRRPPLSWFGVDCVAESIALEAILRRRGLAPELRIGIDPADPSSAHTWVEVDGVPINDSPDVYERLHVFDRTVPPG